MLSSCWALPGCGFPINTKLLSSTAGLQITNQIDKSRPSENTFNEDFTSHTTIHSYRFAVGGWGGGEGGGVRCVCVSVCVRSTCVCGVV